MKADINKKVSFRNTPGVSKTFVCNLSSSTFWFKNNKNMKTIISFLNYWRIKNNLNVEISTRTFSLSGKLIEEKKINFNKGNVVNLCPLNFKDGEGSFEVIVKSDQNLRIPYAAIVAVYETKYGLSAVHSYSRYYSKEEMLYAPSNIFFNGNQGSWTIRDSDNVRSFCVLHNGSETQPSQTMNIAIQNEDGKILKKDIKLPEIQAFGAVKIKLQDHIENLTSFLKNGIGVASTRHAVKNSFARLLIGNESMKDGEDLQATHSNFNFKVQKSDFLNKEDAKVLKHYPGQQNKFSEFLIYPHLVPGQYEAVCGEKKYLLDNNKKIVRVPVENSSRVINFYPKSGPMPTRLQLGLVSKISEKRIPNEVAFTALTNLFPKKRFHWGICGIGKNIDTKIIILDLNLVHTDPKDEKKIIVSYYNTKNHSVLTKDISERELENFKNGISIYEIFKNLDAQKNQDQDNEYGYYSVYSDYGGFLCYSQMTNHHNSITKEHSF